MRKSGGRGEIGLENWQMKREEDREEAEEEEDERMKRRRTVG